MKVIYTVILVLFILFIISFSIANDALVELKYYDFLDIKTPIYMLIFVSFLAGVITAGFMGVVERFRLNRTIAKQNKTIRELRRELKASEMEHTLGSEEETQEPGNADPVEGRSGRAQSL